MTRVGRLLTIALIVVGAGAGRAGTQDPIERIREAEIREDLFMLAGDAMRGREGGTLDEMNASVWLAERARAAGLLPAGDNDSRLMQGNCDGTFDDVTATTGTDGSGRVSLVTFWWDANGDRVPELYMGHV